MKAWIVGILATSALVFGLVAVAGLPAELPPQAQADLPEVAAEGADASGKPANEVPPGPPVWLAEDAPHGPPT